MLISRQKSTTYFKSFTSDLYLHVGRGSSVGIATGYWLDSPGIESRWEAEFSARVQTGPGSHPVPCTLSTRSFPGVKRPGCGNDHLPFYGRGSKKSGAIHLLLFWAFVACSRVTFTFTFYLQSNSCGYPH